MEQYRNNINNKNESQWSGARVGASWQFNVFYFLIRFGGYRTAYFLLYFVVFYYVAFNAQQREKTKYYLSRRFPKRNAIRKFIDSYLMILGLGKVMVDKSIIGMLGMDKIKVDFRNREEILKLIGEKQGIILMLSHTGCWQVALSALRFLKTPVNLLMHQSENDGDRHYFEHSGRQMPYKIIDPDGYLGGTLDMLEALKKNEAICIMGDRVLENSSNTITTNFLGEEIPLHYSAYKMASDTGAPVVVLFSNKKGPDRYELSIDKIIRVPKNLGRSGEKYRPYVEQFVGAMEEYTQKHPYQFYNFYDMWNC